MDPISKKAIEWLLSMKACKLRNVTVFSSLVADIYNKNEEFLQ